MKVRQPVVRVVNETTGTVLADRALYAATFFRRLVGLLGRRELPPGAGLVLVPCAAVHTLFMRFPIDVVFLDQAQRVVALINDLRPYRCPKGARTAHFTVELPAGALAASGTRVGDQLRLLPHEVPASAQPDSPASACPRERGF